MTVAVRVALLRGGDPVTGSAVITASAFVVTLLLALPSAAGGITVSELWPFLLIGLAVPGLSQVAFVHAVRYAGPSRTAILVGAAPLLSVLLALWLLDEPVRTALLLGTLLIVAGSIVLALDPGRPVGFRMLGVVLALVCAGMFALRDNAVRRAAQDLDPPALQAAATSLLGAAIATTVFVLVARRGAARVGLTHAARTFFPAGLLLAGAYAALVAGFDRGGVGVVAPLNATQSLWALLFAAILFHQTEAIGRRTIAASLLVVAGGALIGVSR